MSRQKKLSFLNQTIIGGLIIVIALFLSYQVYMTVAAHPLTENREQVVQLVKEETGLSNIKTFNLVTTDKTYYSLMGTDKEGEAYGVVVPQNKGLIQEFKLSEGVTISSLPKQSEAVTMVDLALYKGKPVWEVNTKSDFKLYDFKTGKEVLQ